MIKIWTAVLLLSVAASAGAQCRPEGRPLFASGLKALAERDLPRAAAQFAALVASEPGCAEARNNLAAVKTEQGRVAEAAQDLRLVVQSHPDYLRARSNLQRIEPLVATAAVPTATSVPPTPIADSPTPTVTVSEATVTPAAPAADTAPAANASIVPPSGPHYSAVPGIALLEPKGATACTIDRARRRLCVYQRVADGIASGACYTMVKVRMGSWPRWVIAAQVDGDGIRLRDDSGRVRFSILATSTTVRGDAVWLAAADFDALAAQIQPLRTGFVLTDNPERAADPAIATDIENALLRWRAVWEEKRFDDFLAQYSDGFTPEHEIDRDHWRAHKRHLFERPGPVSVEIARPSVFVLDDDAAVITVFERAYRSRTASAHDLKAIRWQRQGNDWKISVETVLKQNVSDQIANR